MTMLEASAKSLLDGGCNPVVVVLEPASPCLNLPLFRKRAGAFVLRVLDNPSTSMAYSIREGLKDVPQDSTAIAVLPGDCPGIGSLTIQSLNRIFLQLRKPLLVPTYAGQQGHPRYVGRNRFYLIKSLPDDGHFSNIFSVRSADTVSHEVGEASIVMDADTPNEYNRLLRWSTK